MLAFRSINRPGNILRFSRHGISALKYSAAVTATTATPVRTFIGNRPPPPPFGDWYRPFGPYEVYNKNPGPLSKLLSYIPAPIKSFGIMAGSAALIFFVATPLLIILAPPVFLGIWWYGRKLRKIQKELYEQRWSKMGSNHLTFDPPYDLFTGASSSIPDKSRDRIMKALANNENGVSGTLGYGYDEDLNQLKFTDVESINQDFRGSSQGFQEELEISTYGLVDVVRNRRIANVTVTSHRDVSSGKAKMHIELQSLGNMPTIFEFDGNTTASQSDEDVVIEVGKNNRSNNTKPQ